MASSSTSSVRKSFKYDVFLSFRGEDTRKSFTDHLYDALNRKGINTYKDDVAIRQGNVISDELIQSIEDSRFYIIVFSKRYASSSWCLDELVKIMECHKMSEHTVFPVFYDVEPREVRKQIGAVGEAFSNLENDEAAPKWKEALNEAGRLAGRELKKTANGHEVEFIRIIIEDISKYLPSNNYCFDEKLVGMETRVKNVISYLETDIDDVTMIGIKGIGGGGKTTLARVVYDQISYKFDGISFVEKVREETKVRGLASLQKKILKNVLKDQKIKVSGVSDGINMMRMRMSSTKVLLVLDDVDDIGQRKALAGDRSWFKKGSRIIITTRDENVLQGVNWVHNVNLLSRDEAICLFSRLAFEREVPIQGYEELSRQVVAYAGGLPLTITVLGSLLCDKDLDEWKYYLERLKKFPLEKTLQILELSFLSLPEDQKNIFLNVACILKGWKKDRAIEALESCGLHAKIGLKDLQQKSLITIYYDSDIEHQCVGMHDHLEEMGKNIVRRKDPEEPEKHTRLWLNKEITDILANDLGTKATQYMRLNLEEVNLEIVMKGIRKMQKLRYLHVTSVTFYHEFFDGEQKYDLDSQYLPNSLRYLHWYGYPFCCLPNTFRGDNLVALKMSGSTILRLWEGEERKVLRKLKVLDLRYSMLTIVDLRLIPNVEVLNLGGCLDLVQFHTHHGSLKLKHADLSSSSLETVDLRSALNLEMLNLEDSYDLVELHLPTDGCKLKDVNLSNSKLETVDLHSALDLQSLYLKGCHDLVKLHLPTDGCKLEDVDLSNSKLQTVDLHSALDLQSLYLKDCYKLVELHLPTDGCKLKHVDLSKSKLETVDLHSALDLQSLYLKDCYDLVELHLPTDGCKLKDVNLSNSKLETVDLHSALDLQSLYLKGCDDLVKLHLPTDGCKLEDVDLSNSKLETVDLHSALDLQSLYLKDCYDLVALHLPTDGCKLKHVDLSKSKLETVDLRSALDLEILHLEDCNALIKLHLPADGCLKLTQLHCTGSKLENLHLAMSPNLETLNLNQNKDLVILHMPRKCQNLRSLKLTDSKLTVLNLAQTPYLEHLNLKKCYNLEELLMAEKCEKLVSLHISYSKLKTFDLGIGKLKHLKILTFERCWSLEKLPDDVGELECLEKLYVSHTRIKHLPDSLCMLKTLQTLTLLGCSLLESLPQIFGQLKYLTKLLLSSPKIKHLPETFCMLKHLENLTLDRCSSLEKLPEDLDRLECLVWLKLSKCKSLQDIPISICNMKHLQSLDVSGTCISHLPKNICSMKGLHIKGSRSLLESCGFTSEIETLQYEDACWVTV